MPASPCGPPFFHHFRDLVLGRAAGLDAPARGRERRAVAAAEDTEQHLVRQRAQHAERVRRVARVRLVVEHHLDADAAVVERTSLSAGDQVRGPAVIVEEQTTTVLSSHHMATMQKDGTVLIHRTDAGSLGVDA